MSFKKNSTYACNPATARGQATKLSGTKDGRIVYTNGKAVIIRDIANPTLSFVYSGHTQPVNIARVSPSGYYCASGDAAGNVRIWDTSFLKTGFPPTSVDPPLLKAEYKPLGGRIVDLAWDGESKRIIAVGEARDKFGAAFQMETGTSTGEISGHSKVINAVSIRQQRPFKAVTASDDNTIVFHTGVPFKYEKTISTHTRFVQDVKFSLTGDHFASVGSDAKAFLYDGKTGDQIGEFVDAHTGSIMALSWSPDGRSVLTSSADCTVKLWDVETQKSINVWSLGNGVPNQQVGNAWIGESPDTGLVSLSMNGDLNVFDKKAGDKPVNTLYGPQKGITAATLSEGTFFAGSYDGRVIAYDEQGNASPFPEGSGHGTHIVGLVSSGSKVLSAGFDDKLREIDPAQKSFSDAVESLTGQPKGLAAASNTAAIVTDNGVQVFENGQQVFNLPVNYQPTSVAVSPGGSLVATGGADSKVYLYEWKGEELKEVAKLENNRSAVGALAFSPDGVVLAAGESNGKIVLYDVTTHEMVTNRWAFHTARITSLAWTEDSRHCVSGSLDTHIEVWSRERPAKHIAIKNAIPGGVAVVSWLGASTVAGAGADGCVRTWDISFHA